MQQNFQNGDACCFTGRNPGVDPTAECNVVMAGEVSSDGTCGFASGGGGREKKSLVTGSDAQKKSYGSVMYRISRIERFSPGWFTLVACQAIWADMPPSKL